MHSLFPFRRRRPGLLQTDDLRDPVHHEDILFVPFEPSSFVSPRINRLETPEAYVFMAEFPGLTKNDVKVELEEGNVLRMEGEQRMEKEEKNEKWHRVERSSGKFLQRFRLPENSKADMVSALWDNGVLTVTVPKKESSHGIYNSENNVKTLHIMGE